MSGKRAKICITEGESPVEVRRKTAEILDFPRISVFVASSGRRIGHVDVRAS
jgi:hypothetical protein